jgi:hypothetical protein
LLFSLDFEADLPLVVEEPTEPDRTKRKFTVVESAALDQALLRVEAGEHLLTVTKGLGIDFKAIMRWFPVTLMYVLCWLQRKVLTGEEKPIRGRPPVFEAVFVSSLKENIADKDLRKNSVRVSEFTDFVEEERKKHLVVNSAILELSLVLPLTLITFDWQEGQEPLVRLLLLEHKRQRERGLIEIPNASRVPLGRQPLSVCCLNYSSTPMRLESSSVIFTHTPWCWNGTKSAK